MANDTVPMEIIFRACYDILDEMLLPIHYRTLTELALQSLDVDIENVNYHRQIEDVREKMASVGRMGTFYTSAPLCLVGLKAWFENKQMNLFNGDVTRPIRIIGNVTNGIDGAFESLMRYPHMLRYNLSAPEELRAMGCARGLVVEQHVFGWFKSKWPDLIFSPDNDKNWKLPCSHDFKIKYDRNRIMLVDVWGPNIKGNYNKPPKKKATHLHLQCRVDKGDVIWESVISGDLYKDSDIVLPISGMSPRRLIVWLNCIRDKLPYSDIKQFV